VIVLLPDSTNKLLRRWQGPAIIIQVRSPHSYLIELEVGQRRWLHANKLRAYRQSINEAVVNNCAIIYDTDEDFGTLPVADINENADCLNNPLPSARTDRAKLSHLSPEEKQEF